MNLRRVGAIVLRQYYLMRGSPTRLVPLFAWVAIDIVLWGFLARYLSSVAPQGPNFTFTLLGAVLLWDFFTRIMHGVTTAFLEDVWSRNFLNLFATPLTIFGSVAPKAQPRSVRLKLPKTLIIFRLNTHPACRPMDSHRLPVRVRA